MAAWAVRLPPQTVSPLDFAREPEPDVALPGLLRRATALPGIAFGRRLTLARPSSANRQPPFENLPR